MNQSQASSLEDLTVGELRRALAQGASEMTIREAFAALNEADEIARLHEQTSASYRHYVEARLQRLAAVEQEAMDEARPRAAAQRSPVAERGGSLHGKAGCRARGAGALLARRAAARVRGLGGCWSSRALPGGRSGSR